MKKLKFLLIILILVNYTFTSCDKEDLEGTPGHISGMGNAGGELQVSEPFVLPEGISIVGGIKGVGDASVAVEDGTSQLLTSVIKNDKSGFFRCGSGGQDIILDISLKNEGSVDQEHVFKRGCVFKCLKEGRQNGICPKKVVIHIPAGMIIRFKLLVFCVNYGKRGSSEDVTYECLGVTNSEPIMEVCNRLRSKKINYRSYKSDEMEKYRRRCSRIQKSIWSVTNDSGLSDEDWDYIDSLPEDD